MSKRTLLVALCFFITYGLVAGPVLAAETSDKELEEQNKLLDDEITQEVEKVKEKDTLRKLEVGGWITTIFRDYGDLDNDNNTADNLDNIWFNEIRLWGRMKFSDNTKAYVRIKDSYIDRRITSDSYTGIGDDHDGPHLDVAYLQTKYLFRETDLKLTMGRQYNYIGRGIAYRDVHDGLKVSFETPNLYYKGFVTHTLPNENNIDLSQPQFDKKGERLFSGLEASYIGLPNSVLYGYYLYQKDFSQATFAPDTQVYKYDSQYLGLGIEGEAANINYAMEVIKEFGKSYTDNSSGGTSDPRDVDAWAVDLDLKYGLETTTHPMFEFEYGYGSGDKDRVNVTDSNIGGNLNGKDKNFLYFGTYQAGYALTPRLSNIHIYKAQASFFPFEKTKIGKDIAFGTKYYYYLKDKTEGGISDEEATNANKYIGSETDFYAYWDINPKTTLSVRYGVFFPGDAYPTTTDTKTQYVYSRLMYRF